MKFSFIIFLVTFLLLSASIRARFLEEGKKRPLGFFDLGYTLAFNENDPADIRKAWDHAHAVATLQGIVNRESPRLYVLFVENEGINIDRYWWEKYRKPGEWLNSRDTIVYSTIVELVNAHKSDIKGAVVYDPAVAATSNVASAVAGEVMFSRYPVSSSLKMTTGSIEGLPALP